MRSRDPDASTLPQLLVAAVSRPDRARAAWTAWSSREDIENVTWQELRLLGVVAARRADLGIADALQPRLEGIRRFIWSSTQFRVAGAMPVLRRLVDRGVPFCLLKGAALLAGGHLQAGERFMRDVDILVQREHLPGAVDALLEMGWRTRRLGSREEIFSLGFPRLHAVDFACSDDPERAIDLHISALSLNRLPHSDDSLWKRTRVARLFGVRVRVPQTEDLMCIALAHSHLSDREQGHDWAVDATALARAPGFDWEIFFEEVHRRGLELLVRERLEHLLALGAISLPDSAAKWLESARPDPDPVRAHRVRDARGPTPAAPLPAPLPWLRWDLPIPEALSGNGASCSLRICGRIRHAARSTPFRFWLYCGSVRLARGIAIPLPMRGHRFDTRLDIDPAVLAAEGESSLSFYFGRRSRDTGVMNSRSELHITRVEVR